MSGVDVRRLAAIDMHGASGSDLRRRVILAEFVLGAVAGIALGGWLVSVADSIGWRIFGLWLIGVGCNYVPLALHAISLYRPEVLKTELSGVDILPELRRYTVLQVWVFVPFALVFFAIRQRG